MMKKIILAIALLVVIVALVGCGAETTTTVETEGDTTTTTTTTTTDDGDVTTTITGTEGAEGWCPEGGDWTMTVEGTTEGQATWKVDKIIDGGQFDGLCHVIYTAEGPEGEIIIDYYFNEDGSEGYFEMDVNGEKITQEWHSDE